MSVKNGEYFPGISFSRNVLCGFGANSCHPALLKVGRVLTTICWLIAVDEECIFRSLIALHQHHHFVFFLSLTLSMWFEFWQKYFDRFLSTEIAVILTLLMW